MVTVAILTICNNGHFDIFSLKDTLTTYTPFWEVFRGYMPTAKAVGITRLTLER